MLEQPPINIEKLLSKDKLLEQKLLMLFQISSGTFPVGGFCHSMGLETYVWENKVKNVEDVKKYISVMLSHSLVKSDVVVARRAYRAAVEGDYEKIQEIDKFGSALKLVKEFRQASIKMGRAMLRLTDGMFQHDLLRKYRNTADVYGGGNFSAVFGTVCGCLGLGERQTVLAFLFSTVCNSITAATKLVPLGHIEAQKALADLYPLLTEMAEVCMGMDLDDIGSFMPAIDIAGMRHEHLYTRLYMS